MMVPLVTRHSSLVTAVALIGSDGMLANAVRRLAPASWRITPLDLPEFDITDRNAVGETLGALKPDVVLNCAAYTDVDGCESREALAMRVNGEGVAHLAESARTLGATLVHISTDYVFDGTKGTPYTEEDVPSPQSAYGRSKLAGERAVLESGLEEYFIVRTSWLYGPGGKNFVGTIARLAREREELRIVADQVGSPTFTHDLAQALFRLLALGGEAAGQPGSLQAGKPGAGSREPDSHSFYGLYHFANEGICSWYEFAEAIVEHLRHREPLKVREIRPITTAEYPVPAKRPPYSVLSKEKYKAATDAEVPAWEDGLRRYWGAVTSDE